MNAIASEKVCAGINSKNPKLTKVYKDRLKEFEDMNSDKEIVLGKTTRRRWRWSREKRILDCITRIGEGDVQVEFNLGLDGVL